MGNNPSKKNGVITPAQMQDYEKASHHRLTEANIKHYYVLFHQFADDKGEMDYNSFSAYIHHMEPETPKDAKLDHVFRAIDKNKDGAINFREYLLFQSIVVPEVTGGQAKPVTNEELIGNIFASYDEDGDGFITEEEMRDCMEKSAYMAGYDSERPDVQNMINARIKKLMESCDKNKDDKITREELMEACKVDPSILQLI